MYLEAEERVHVEYFKEYAMILLESAVLKEEQGGLCDGMFFLSEVTQYSLLKTEKREIRELVGWGCGYWCAID